MRNFGFAGPDNVVHIGTNGKMSEVSGAMGITSLESMDDFIDLNRHNYEQYRAELSQIPGVELYRFEESEKTNFQYVVLLIDEEASKISRDSILEILSAENVLARRYFYPGCHRMEPYRSYQPHAGLVLPHTESVAARVLVLPTGSNIDADKIRTICGLLSLIVDNAQPIREALAQDAGHP
jgi:dTDP-4-amino-4,6-dideoxygalactose transaminase